jgi:hypothetical protein
MVQIDTKNIHAYCEPSSHDFCYSMLGFAHLVLGLAFAAYWGVVLFGYDASALRFSLVLRQQG